jgi:parallel beta-helix repeat protein
VGGAAPAAGNVISGNGTGVFINSISHPVIVGAYNSLVQGNIIGLNATATQPVGNTTGVLITNSYNLIGGSGPAAWNLIAGNQGNGVQIVHTQPLYPTIHNLVIGNRIGTDWTGIRSFGNGLDGVLIGDGAKLNLVRDNRVLFNARDGISLENADKNTIRSNTNCFNGRDGLRVDASSSGNILIENTLLENEVLDAHDESAGTGTAHTANRWLFNAGRTEDPIGLLWFHL